MTIAANHQIAPRLRITMKLYIKNIRFVSNVAKKVSVAAPLRIIRIPHRNYMYTRPHY